MIEAGGIYNHIEVENRKGDIIADSKHGLGLQAGIGMAVPLSEFFRLTPTIRYKALSRDITIGKVRTPVDLNHLSLGVGLEWNF